MNIDLRLPPLWDETVEARIRYEAYSIDEQVTPTSVQFCRRCVVSNQRPRITFDSEGVCSACRYAERQRGEIDWNARAVALAGLLERHRKKVGYDVIVPCSGGKDSAMVAHRLKHEHGMTPLCVKWAPFVYTDIGFQNFNNFIHSGFDCMVMWPNGIIHRKLARLAFEYLGDAWQPFAYGQLCYAMHMAVRFNIPLVMFGENGEALYGGDSSADDKPCWDFADWNRVYLKGAGVERLVAKGRDLGCFTDEDIRSISEFYSLPRRELMQGTEFHWWSYYRPWWPMDNFYYATEHTGFAPNTERSESTFTKYASLDDKLDPFHYYMAWWKFGIGRATSDASQQIRAGDLTRAEGVELVKRYDGEFPAKNFDLFKEYLNLDDEGFARVCMRYKMDILKVAQAPVNCAA